MTKRSGADILLLVLVIIGLAAPVLVLASGAVVKTYRVSAGAMEPTLPEGVRIVVRRTRDVARGDLVAFCFPRDRRVTYAKRAVALGGDLVEIKAKRLLVNGIAVNEPYVRHEDSQVFPVSQYVPEPYRSRDHFGPYRVKAGEVFMLGDNRDRSSDSRFWGSVPSADLIGRVILAVSLRQGVWRPR